MLHTLLSTYDLSGTYKGTRRETIIRLRDFRWKSPKSIEIETSLTERGVDRHNIWSLLYNGVDNTYLIITFHLVFFLKSVNHPIIVWYKVIRSEWVVNNRIVYDKKFMCKNSHKNLRGVVMIDSHYLVYLTREFLHSRPIFTLFVDVKSWVSAIMFIHNVCV